MKLSKLLESPVEIMTKKEVYKKSLEIQSNLIEEFDYSINFKLTSTEYIYSIFTIKELDNLKIIWYPGTKGSVDIFNIDYKSSTIIISSDVAKNLPPDSGHFQNNYILLLKYCIYYIAG